MKEISRQLVIQVWCLLICFESFIQGLMVIIVVLFEINNNYVNVCGLLMIELIQNKNSWRFIVYDMFFIMNVSISF